MKKLSMIGTALLGGVILGGVPISLHQSPGGLSLSFDRAQAVIGQPLTPGSVAGVHRRIERSAIRRCAVGVTCPHY